MTTDDKSVSDLRHKNTSTTLTSQYFEEQIRTRNLDQMCASVLLHRHPGESFEEILGHVGLWLATWGAQGWCDKHIAEGKPPTVSTLVYWLSHKLHHHQYAFAQDALSRAWGKRTQTEVRTRVSLGTLDYIHPKARHSDPEAPEARYSSRGDKGRGGDREENAEQFCFVTPEKEEDFEDEWKLAIDIISVLRVRSSERYIRVAEYLFDGLSLTEVAEREGVSESRASKLFQRVRSDLRDGPKLVAACLKLLALISEEPWSTVTEIEDEIGPESGQALQLLRRRGLIQEGHGQCYAPTNAGRTAAEVGVI